MTKNNIQQSWGVAQISPCALRFLSGFRQKMLRARRKYNYANRSMGLVGTFLLTGLFAPPAFSGTAAPAEQAAVSSATTHAWALDACLRRAMENNPSIRSAREGLKAAQGSNLMAVSEFVPSLSWSSIYIRNDKTALGSLASSIPGLRPSMTSEDYYTSSLSVDQTLFSWRMKPLRKTMSATTKLARQKLAAMENDLTLNVKKAFYTALYANQLLAIAQAAEGVARENLEASQGLYREGKVSSFDVSRANVRHVNAKTGVISAKNFRTMSLEGLRVLLSLPAGEDMDITGEFEQKERTAVLDDEMSVALSRRPELNMAKEAETLQASARELARAGFLPRVFAGFAYSWEGTDFSPGSRNDYRSWTAKAGIAVPIFDGLFSFGRFSAEKAGLAQAKEQVIGTRDGVVMEVRQSYYSLANARESLLAQKENVENSAENLRIAQERYRMGLLSLLDLKDAELSHIDARTQQIKTLYDYNVAMTSLDRATGLPSTGNN